MVTGYFFKKNIFLSPKIYFVSVNSANPVEILYQSWSVVCLSVSHFLVNASTKPLDVATSREHSTYHTKYVMKVKGEHSTYHTKYVMKVKGEHSTYHTKYVMKVNGEHRLTIQSM